MRNYDLVLVLRPSLKETERKKILDWIKDSLGKVKLTVEEWGQKPLAYVIKRELAGYYVALKIEAETIPVGLDQKILTKAEILRHLLLRTK